MTPLKNFSRSSAGADDVTDATPILLEPAGTAGNRSTRMGLWALAIGLGGFLLWAGFAPLDEGVPGPGMVAIDTKKKAVQHLTGGLIKEVFVREGDQVKEGQLLVRLDEAVAKANLETIRQRYIGLRATESRLQAEQRGLPKISFHPDVVEAAAQDAQIKQMVFNQEQLFQSRRSGQLAEIQSIEESILGQEGMIQAYGEMLTNRKQQKALLADELANTKTLVSEGYAPRNRQLELERMSSEISSGLAELQGNTIRARRSVSELKQRVIVRRQEVKKEVETLLADVGREVEADAEKFRAARDDLSRIDIKSPAAGQVVAIAFQSAGGVVGPGQKLMDIVPQDQSLLIEARVAPHLIDKVRTGLNVDVRFSSFANSPQLVVDGKVVSVSSDLIVDAQTSVSYYLARIAVTNEGYVKLGKRQLQSGMPVEVVFITGERSMLTYLLHPLTKRLAASMKEE